MAREMGLSGALLPPPSSPDDTRLLGGSTWTTSLRLRPDLSFLVRLTTGANGTSADAVVNAGGILRDWSVGTPVLDATPNAFSIPAMTAQPANTLVQSAWVTPTGYLDPAPISVAGGEILVEGDTT